MTCTHDKSIARQIKAPGYNNHRLLMYHNNGPLRYCYRTSNIIVHHYRIVGVMYGLLARPYTIQDSVLGVTCYVILLLSE